MTIRTTPVTIEELPYTEDDDVAGCEDQPNLSPVVDLTDRDAGPGTGDDDWLTAFEERTPPEVLVTRSTGRALWAGEGPLGRTVPHGHDPATQLEPTRTSPALGKSSPCSGRDPAHGGAGSSWPLRRRCLTGRLVSSRP